MMSIEVRSEKDVKKGMTDALFWAGYLKDKEEEIDLFGSPPKGFRKKGGEGSGHHDHGGLSGVWGGSTPSGGSGESELSPENIAAQEHHAAEKRKREELLEAMGNTHVVNEQREPLSEHERAAFTRLTDLVEDDLKYMFALPDAASTTIILEDEIEGPVSVMWFDQDGKILGRAAREFPHHTGQCKNHSLILNTELQDRGIAASLYARQRERLKEWGYDTILLEADISIGRYAWAKEGFEYADPASAGYARTGLKHWLGRNGMRDLAKKHADRISKLNSPRDFATFSIPDVMILGKQIENIAVKPNYEMIVGKAFMLDRGGHGSWHGRYEL